MPDHPPLLLGGDAPLRMLTEVVVVMAWRSSPAPPPALEEHPGAPRWRRRCMEAAPARSWFMHERHRKRAAGRSYGLPLQGSSTEDGTQRSLLLTNSRNAGNDLLAYRLVYDSVHLHSGLLNWLQNQLEMVLLLYTSHNSPSHQPRAISYLGDDISIRVCQPLTAAL